MQVGQACLCVPSSILQQQYGNVWNRRDQLLAFWEMNIVFFLLDTSIQVIYSFEPSSSVQDCLNEKFQVFPEERCCQDENIISVALKCFSNDGAFLDIKHLHFIDSNVGPYHWRCKLSNLGAYHNGPFPLLFGLDKMASVF